MFNRFRGLAARPVRELPAGLVLGVCALVLVAGAVLISTTSTGSESTQSRAETAPEDREITLYDEPEEGEPSYEVTNPPAASHDPIEEPEALAVGTASPADRRRARKAARMFLAEYLPYSYGRRPAKDVGNVTPVLEVILTEKPPRPPADADERHPRVELLQLEHADGREAEVIAVIDDEVTSYTLHVRMTRTWDDGWIIATVGPH